MADKNQDQELFNNLVKEFNRIQQDSLTISDRRLRINKNLIDSVKDLNDAAKEYNQIQAEGDTFLNKIRKEQKNYTDDIRKAAQTEVALSKRKVDLVKRVNELQESTFKMGLRGSGASAKDLLRERQKLKIAEGNLENLEKSIVQTAELRNNLQAAADAQGKIFDKTKAFLNTKLNDVIGAFGFEELRKELGESNKQTVEIAKTLGVSVGEAAKFSFEFTKASLAISQAAINTKELKKGFLDLATNVGTAKGFTVDQVVAQTELTKLVGLQGKEAASLIGLGILNNKTNKEITSEILNQVSALEAETGIRLDGRKLLAEVANINGQLAAQFQFNNKLLAEAVVKTKQFGLTLQQAANIGNSLLEFETSIGDELTAELLIGKQLNLERARLLALQGDSAEAAAEVAKQFGSASEFTSMNVLQQRSLAKAVGLTADQLSDAIRQRDILRNLGAENLDQLKEEGRLNELLTQEGGKQLYDQLLQQDVNEKFLDLLNKIKSTIVSVVEAFTPLIDITNAILNSSIALGAVFGAIATAQIPKLLVGFGAMIIKQRALLRLARMRGVASIFGSFAGAFGPVGLALAGAAVGAMLAAVASANTADDLAYGDNMLVTKNQGTFALNNNDQIIAGTNLFGGNTTTNPINENKFIDRLAGVINNKRVVFDSFTASGPEGFIETDRRRQNLTFL
jgi:hypothetical protein